MKTSSGFTLIELLIIIAIIGVLIGMMLPALIASQKKSYDSGAQACAKSIETVQGLSQIDNRSYMSIGSGADKINRLTDGINEACKINTMLFKDRSPASNMTDNYIIDVWDVRGSRVFTITPSYLKSDAEGATPFSESISSGINLP